MTRSLADKCDIIIHEAYGFEDTVPGHGSISTCLDFARKAGTKRLALVHMQRDVRIQCVKAIKDIQREYTDFEILLPETGSTFSL